MEREATTTELAEILGVTPKTICEWAKTGIMENVSYGKYNLKNSLRNWAEYQKCIFEGHDDPLNIWQIRQEIAWSEAHYPRDVDVRTLNLIPLHDLELETFEVELDAAGRIVQARRASA